MRKFEVLFRTSSQIGKRLYYGDDLYHVLNRVEQDLKEDDHRGFVRTLSMDCPDNERYQLVRSKIESFQIFEVKDETAV